MLQQFFAATKNSIYLIDWNKGEQPTIRRVIAQGGRSGSSLVKNLPSMPNSGIRSVSQRAA